MCLSRCKVINNRLTLFAHIKINFYLCKKIAVMSEFYIVSNVVHRNGMTLYTDHEGKEQSLHESQGTLDGACAIYSLIMALKRRRHINNADVPIYKKLDKRSKKR